MASRRPFGTHVDDPVGGLDDVQAMLDDEHRVALLDEPVQDFEEFASVLKVQTGRRLVQNVQRFSGPAADEFLRELDALRLAAGKRRRGLTSLM